MYHPAPAVKRGHLGNVKSGGCIALPGLLKILLCGADESALLELFFLFVVAVFDFTVRNLNCRIIDRAVRNTC